MDQVCGVWPARRTYFTGIGPVRENPIAGSRVPRGLSQCADAGASGPNRRRCRAGILLREGSPPSRDPKAYCAARVRFRAREGPKLPRALSRWRGDWRNVEGRRGSELTVAVPAAAVVRTEADFDRRRNGPRFRCCPRTIVTGSSGVSRRAADRPAMGWRAHCRRAMFCQGHRIGAWVATPGASARRRA